jgi:hypothetical protein
MPDWNTRLAVSYTDDEGNDVVVKPIDSFTPSFSINAEPISSIEAINTGVIFSPESLSFSMTVKAIGPVAAQLTALALQGRRFNITLQEGTGDDWSLRRSSCRTASSRVRHPPRRRYPAPQRPRSRASRSARTPRTRPAR